MVAATALIGAWRYGRSPADLGGTPAEHTMPSSTADVPTSVALQNEAEEGLPAPERIAADAPFLEGTADDDPVSPVENDASTMETPLPSLPAIPETGRPLVQPEQPPAIAVDTREPGSATPPPQPSGTPATESRDVARAEQTPPLEPPVQAPIAPPRPMRAMTGESQASGAIAPVPPVMPAPPPQATTTPAASAVPRSAADTSAVQEAVNGYADAFSALDASATQRVWPGADLRGLRRAFDQLSAQTITFDRCDVKAAGEAAEAVCTGRQAWVPKVGDRRPRSEARTWRFALGRDGSEWVIDKVQVQQ
jgi:hypothetical protein